MPNLEELKAYKRTIVGLIVNDRDCVNLITNTTNMTLPAASLIDTEVSENQIHLYDYVPGTVEDQRVHVCIEVADSVSRSKNVRDYIIEIDVIVPESMMRMTGDVRRDAIAVAIDKLINANPNFGFETVESLPGQYGIPVEGFRDRSIRYRVSGWNNKGVKV